MSTVTGQSAIAVFGSSEPSEESPAYREALEVGGLLATAGFTVINGGYGGVMEASARGAKEAGGTTIGVTIRAFRRRSGANRFIDTEFCEKDLFERTRKLIETATGFIVLQGGSGTLSELTFLWALQKADLLGSRPILLVGPVWAETLDQLRRLRLVHEADLASTSMAATPREAVDMMARSLRGVR